MPMNQELPTTLTKPHRQLIEALRGCDFDVEVEAMFPPKRVDCYLPLFHLAFEADGPAHSLAKDDDRDAYLMIQYALPVVHLTSEELARSALDVTRILIRAVLAQAWQESTVERRLIAMGNGALQDAYSY